MLEAWLVDPEFFSVYVDNVHGWLLGLICFFLGFVFISAQDVFWPAVERIRWPALVAAFSVYLVRLLVFELQGEPAWMAAFESMSWMLAAIGFGARYLNRASRLLAYLSKAVYPVYIVHFPVQFVIAYFLLPTGLSAYAKLALLLAGTFGICLFLYEFILRRMKWIRPLFGIKLKEA
jgi:peptidoglycan/LPS O-acetylase OafA/YrhL